MARQHFFYQTKKKFETERFGNEIVYGNRSYYVKRQGYGAWTETQINIDNNQ